MHLTAALLPLQVAEMTEAEFDALWKHYINVFAALLVEAGGDLGAPAGRRITRLVYELGVLKGAVLMSHPSRIHCKLVQPMPPGRRPCMLRALQLRRESRAAAESPGWPAVTPAQYVCRSMAPRKSRVHLGSEHEVRTYRH